MKKITIFLGLLFIATLSFGQLLPITLKYSKNDYTWNTGNRSRDASFNNGKIYAVENNTTSSTIHVIDGATGAELTAENVLNEWFNSFTVTSDYDGALYVATNNTGGGSNFLLTKVDLPSTVSKVNDHSIIGASIRTDYLEAYKVDATNTYIAGASINSTPQVVRVWTVTGATISAPITFSGVYSTSASGSDIKWINSSKILLTGQSKIPTIVTLNMTDGTFTKSEIGAATYAFGGSAYFEVSGTPYVVLPTDGLGQFDVFKISDPAAPVKVAENKTTIGAVANASIHMGLEAFANGNTVSIYVWSPNNGLAVHEIVFSATGVDQIGVNAKIIRTPSGVEVSTEGRSVIELYNINGSLIEKTELTNQYSRNLENGIYIIRVDGKSYKFVK